MGFGLLIVFVFPVVGLPVVGWIALGWALGRISERTDQPKWLGWAGGIPFLGLIFPWIIALRARSWAAQQPSA